MPDALSPVLIFTVFERYHCAVFTAMQTEVRKVKHSAKVSKLIRRGRRTKSASL